MLVNLRSYVTILVLFSRIIDNVIMLWNILLYYTHYVCCVVDVSFGCQVVFITWLNNILALDQTFEI